jgi:hypothetical protein
MSPINLPALLRSTYIGVKLTTNSIEVIDNFLALESYSQSDVENLLNSLTVLRNSFANNHIAKYKAFETIIQTIKEYNLDVNAAEYVSITDLSANYQPLGDYALASSLSSYAPTSSLSAYATASSLPGSVQVGTLGSFYSCTNLSDTSPTLIATGSSNITLNAKAIKQCNKWAIEKSFKQVTSALLEDASTAPVFASKTGTSGSCFEVAGGMFVRSLVFRDDTTIKSFLSNMQLRYSDPNYILPSMRFLIPSLVVVPEIVFTCSDNICSTSRINYSCTTTDNLVGSTTGKNCTAASSNPNTDYNIPGMTAISIPPTVGSLAALCIYELDH